MKFSSAIALLAVLLFSTWASAGIIGVDCYNDGDGAITMNDWWSSDLTGAPTEVDVYLDEALHWAPRMPLSISPRTLRKIRLLESPKKWTMKQPMPGTVI